jgi:hypothetical protein
MGGDIFCPTSMECQSLLHRRPLPPRHNEAKPKLGPSSRAECATPPTTPAPPAGSHQRRTEATNG